MRSCWLLLAGLILALLLAAGGCWDWSFPEELLREDGPPPGKKDAARDGPADADADLTGDLPHPNEAGVDTQPKLDTTTSCPTTCSGPTPVCDTTTWTCRPCRTHAECAARGELCALDGSCPPAGAISYVSSKCGSDQNGTMAKPYCKVNDAVSGSHKYILVRSGTYGPATIDDNHEVHGEPGATISSSSCPGLTIDGVTASVVGLTIKGGVDVKGGASAKATLVANTIGPAPICIGVLSGADTKVVLQRNFIHLNKGGGLLLLDTTYQVENNIIAANGNTSPNWGGAKLKPKGTSTFINNTVVDNVSKGGNEKEAGGVRCEGALNLVNNIFWGNTSNATKKPEDARQYGDSCTATYSVEQLPSGATPTPTNSGADPMFAPGTGAAAYHIKKGSPAVDSGKVAGAPKVDFDNQARGALPDIGADELVP